MTHGPHKVDHAQSSPTLVLRRFGNQVFCILHVALALAILRSLLRLHCRTVGVPFISNHHVAERNPPVRTHDALNILPTLRRNRQPGRRRFEDLAARPGSRWPGSSWTPQASNAIDFGVECIELGGRHRELLAHSAAIPRTHSNVLVLEAKRRYVTSIRLNRRLPHTGCCLTCQGAELDECE